MEDSPAVESNATQDARLTLSVTISLDNSSLKREELTQLRTELTEKSLEILSETLDSHHLGYYLQCRSTWTHLGFASLSSDSKIVKPTSGKSGEDVQLLTDEVAMRCSGCEQLGEMKILEFAFVRETGKLRITVLHPECRHVWSFFADTAGQSDQESPEP